jgi:predicted small secreted protein
MRVITVALCCLLLAACSSSSGDTADVDTGTTAITNDSGGKLVLGVNSYLWQASLNTLSFMPLASADPFGGVIITNWYSAPDDPNERMKVTVYILSRQLRADGLKIAVFRQTHSANGWVDAQVNPDTATKLEDAILTRARELRLASEGSGS